jgi:uncharacterized protein
MSGGEFQEICITLRYAMTFYDRLRGLIAYDKDFLSGDEALCFETCRSIHTFGMKFSLDIACIGSDGEVIQAIRALKPGKIIWCRHAHVVCERPAAPTPWFLEGDKTVIISKGEMVFMQVLERREA